MNNSWNRRGGPKGRGGSKVEMHEWGGELFDLSTTPALRATPPVPGGELLSRYFFWAFPPVGFPSSCV